ncbi:hypothetical protein A6X20_20085 [Bradyrhizobium elkanii]|nr:hypothetical protein A6X20_20085 [Bradyrhizobium elkanii]
MIRHSRFCSTIILTATVQPGQRLILGTRQFGLKPPLASAMPVADIDRTRTEGQKMMIEVRGI